VSTGISRFAPFVPSASFVPGLRRAAQGSIATIPRLEGFGRTAGS